MDPDSTPTPTPGRGPSPVSLSELKGCGTLLAVCAVALIIGGCFKQREDARTINHLLKVMDSVQTDLEKGRVRQALDTLHVEFHTMESR